jgi:hypothetical protein
MNLLTKLLNGERYWLTRLVLQRGLALVYLIAFIVVLHQFNPLLGEHGLLPVPRFVAQVPFAEAPSLFYGFPNDFAFDLFGWIGVALSLVALSGVAERFGNWASASLWFLLWVIDLSFVNVGQTFYGFGWESLLLEAGFLAIFLGGRTTTPPRVMIIAYQWLLFRLMFGAGLIKLRGDPCWRELTCLDYFYETQPMPNPWSWYFHWQPEWFHKLSVVFNHFTELVVPFAYFAPTPVSGAAGIVTLLFHGWLFSSGNFAFLGFLTLVITLSTISDSWWSKLLRCKRPVLAPPGRVHSYILIAVGLSIAALSIYPVMNMLSPGQEMNASFEPFHIVNTYGAFGSVTRPRFEVVIEGTEDSEVNENTRWREYEFIGKPGDVMRVPPQIAPYHLRLDWLMWFAAFSSPQDHPWFIGLLGRLLENDKPTLSLIHYNPFPKQPPKYVRALLYEYHFTTPGERRKTGAIWTRKLAGIYFPAVSLDDAQFRQMVIDISGL